ncbi:inosine-uridine nucleoside N-ribohydrolase [Sedimentibacter acidaminivorans]|uniref:Inosine-uridine nucleoside N-ribohydrolase n=1 Tax=Sedimentibacter acidaminivorans TaxID=913099 RepID=A0ABS4G9V3_9FIRM|nr:nucleoside hydrolase [Sedimentibacter acidaminivorans]MBP1924476.1 inosine-uridine nucleoside N-ribohydrolase [Sedimentibacter acidaminivorans]
MKKRNIIIDCDPGIDDIIALSFAIANEDKLNILGITTVAGNQSIEKVTSNTLKLISFFNKDIKIAKGQKGPLLREKCVVSKVHGENGMGDYELPEPKIQLSSDNAITFLRDTILNCEDMVTLVPIGPLTNIALLIKTFPEVVEKIELLSIMGGSTDVGNYTPSAEFNVWADPEAANIVFKSGIPIVMSGLNVTHTTGLYREDVDSLLKSNGKVTHMCGKILDFYFKGDHVNNGKFTPIHDACSIMYLLYPEIYKYRHMKVEVDCSEGLNRGNTVADVRDWVNYDETYPKVLLEVDSDKFTEILLSELYKLDNIMK